MKINRARILAALVLLLSTIASQAAAKSSGKYLMYVGTYTNKTESKGIYAYTFDAATGKTESLGLAAETTNPSFLASSPDGKFLYVANEVDDYKGERTGGVSAFSIDHKTGKLVLLNEVPSRGADPCYVTVDAKGKVVFVANYTGGNLAGFPVQANGGLGEASIFVQHEGKGANPERQEGPHAHSIDLSRDNRFAVAADLGLDELTVYRFDPAKGTLTANDPPYTKLEAGSGPRHFAFHPNGKFAYAVTEMKSAVTAFSYDSAKGVLRELNTVSALPKDFKGPNDDAEIQVHPNGKFLYASNRGHDSITVLAIESAKGTVTPVDWTPTGGKTPRNFSLDPTGKLLFAANQASDNIVVFRVDQKTGKLTATGEVLKVPSPVCIRFVKVE